MSTSAEPSTERAATGRRSATFGWSLGMVLRHWHECVEEVLHHIPHGSRGYHLLSVVVHEEVPTQAVLAGRLVIDRSVLTYVIDDLEAAGLIERRRDPRDRRARRIVATEQGRRALLDAERQVGHAQDQVLRGLPAQQRAAFCATVEQAAEAIMMTARGTDPCAAVDEVLGQPDDC
ncbi:MarR family winged helix-turn-helix transcriptional regulator [Streptomyces sp. B93]|uniref:MarR family winged helix-turn-helix transcriptional regulator n=1 Tax=Streptomyces sp. B93 TaxID=2824875 RepID=UPI001B35A114|nr:MarR family winged helix-turn-helix transcriptional regulator [Streptomyces sp. B93]MBQ1091929.1 winged helix-turn-helix transcriptional regulator [Streptomyces sp. B93]